MNITHMYIYIEHLVLSAVSSDHGRSWNVLPVDTGALLYLLPLATQYAAERQPIAVCKWNISVIGHEHLMV
jgi:hypothetical protein